MTSRCGMARRRPQSSAMRRSERSKGSPPDMITSRISTLFRFELGHGDLLGVAYFPAAGAEAAIRGAYRRHEEQRTVRIAVSDVRRGRVSVLGQRVHEAVVYFELLQVGHVLPPDGVSRRFDEVHHRGGDPKLEILRRLSQPLEVGKVFGAELGDERFERGDALLTQ